MNIYDVLKQEHLTVLDLVEEATESTGLARDGLVERIVDELTAHAMAEDEVLYDRMTDDADARSLVLEAKEEHLAIARLLADVVGGGLEDEIIEAKLDVLLDQLEHHIEEEEDEIFTAAEKIFDDEIAEAMGAEFLNKKEAVQQLDFRERLQEAVSKAADEGSLSEESPLGDGEARI